jgi:1-deoxy-D-xylulose-5-phosphate synthase
MEQHTTVFWFSLFALYSNIIIHSPLNEIALQNILYTASLGLEQPIAIRYQEVDE